MSASTISLILSILLAVFLVWGAVWGLIRGLKTTLYRGVFLIIVIVLAFFISTVITKVLLNADFGVIIDMKVGGQKANSLNQLATLYIQEELQISADATGAISAISALISIVLNAIIFTLLFWVFKWILSPVFSIISRFIINRKQYRKETIEKKNGKTKIKRVKIKKKKYRLFGGLVGVALGLFVCTFTFVPVLGYLNVIRKVETGTEDNGKGIVSNALGSENYTAITDGYDKSAMGVALKYTGMEFISSVMFDSLTTTKVNETRVSLNKEVDTGIEVYNLVKDIKMPDLNTCTKEEFSSFLTNTRQLINISFKSGVVNSSLDGFMPLIVDYLRQQDMIEEMEYYQKTLIVNALSALSEFNSNIVKTEILGVVGLLNSLNDHGLLLPVVQNNTGEVIPFLQATTNHNVVNDIIDKLFALKMVDTVAPDLVNLMLNYISTAFDVESDDVTEITSAQLKTSLQSILTCAVDLIHEIDMDSDYYVKTSGIVGVGKTIDAIKNSYIVSDEMFDSIIDKVQDNLLERIADVPSWAQPVGREAINNLHNVQNFTTEFEKVYTIVTTIEDACKKQDGNSTDDIADVNFAKLGQAIDTMEELVLVSRDNIPVGQANNLVKKALVDCIDEYTNDASLNTDMSTFSSIDRLKQNIVQSTNVSWTSEMPKIKALVVNGKNLMTEEGAIIDKLRDDSRKEDFVVLGEALDQAKTSSLFNNQVDRLFMIDILNEVDDSYADDEDMLEAINSIKENINTAQSITWGVEFGCIVDLINMDFDNVLQENSSEGKSNAYYVGEKIDNVVSVSVLIDKKTVDKFISTVVADSFKDSSYENITNRLLENFKDTDKNSSNGYQNNIQSYAVEFDALNNLYQAYLLVSDPEFDFTRDAEVLGNRLETAMNTSAIINNELLYTTLVSEELVDVMVNDMLDEKFDENNDDFAYTLTKIKGKFTDIDENSENGYENGVDSYTVEIIALSKMEKIANKANSADFDFKEDGRILGRDIDTTLNTSYLFAGTTYRTKVVNKELIDEYVRSLIDKNVSGDDGLGPTVEAIKSKFDDIESVPNYQNSVDYYEVEFDALARLLGVVDISKDNFDGNDPSDRLVLAGALDSAMASVDIGTSGTPNLQRAKSVTPYTTNPYIKTKVSFNVDGDYATIVNDVKENINAYLDSMITDASKTYTQCFEAINDLDEIVDGIASTTTGSSWYSKEILAELESKVEDIQNTTLGGVILGRKVMIEILTKFDYIVGGKVTPAVYEEKVRYIHAYREYLNLLNLANNLNPEPYTSTNEDIKNIVLVGISIDFLVNQPLQFIYDRFQEYV